MKTKKKESPASRFTRGERVTARHGRKGGRKEDHVNVDEGNGGTYGHPRKPGEEPTS